MLKKVYTLLIASGLLVAAPVVHHSINKKQSTKTTNNKNTKNSRYKSYTVQHGDTLYSIARKFKVSMGDLTKLNNIKGNLIHPGDTIKVPNLSYVEKAKKAVEKNNKSVYRVRRGDTLRSIARKFNMKVEDIRRLNSFKKGKILKVGSEINVYAKKKIVERRKRVTKVVVGSGDTLWKIAKNYGLTMKEIRILNPRIRTRGLRRGMILNVSKERAQELIKLSQKRKKDRLKGLLARYKRTYTKADSADTKRRMSSVGRNNRVVRYAKRFLGTRYVWGANNGRAFDCSGFTQYVMKHAKGKNIPRVSRRQAYYGMYVPRSRLRASDLVFFDTSRRRRGYVNHVGIYIGNHYFIHASSAKHRVVITSLNRPFYRQRFMWGRRIN